jgi:glycosyltransferase involved in cell wall biosynthesis
MNVLFLTQYFSRNRGGSEAVFYQWSKELSSRGHNVYVICQDEENLEPDDFNSVNVIHVSPPAKFGGGLPSSASDNLRYVFNTIKIGIKVSRKNNIDIVHANNFFPIFAGYIISKVTKKPYVSTIHDLFSVSGFDYWRKWAKQSGTPYALFVGPLIEKLAVKTPAVNHTISLETKNDIIKFGGSNPIFVFPNGVNLAEFPSSPCSIKNRNQIVFVGRLVFYKNVLTIIKAMKIVCKTIPDVRFIVIGNGPMKEDLEDLSKELNLQSVVSFKGNVSHEEKIQVIQDSKALVLPSVFEGFGIVILESFAMRRPVIVSNVPPLNELVTNDVDGYLVSPFDENEWADRILRMLRNPVSAMQMGENGRKKVEKSFTIQRTVDQLENLYNRMI